MGKYFYLKRACLFPFNKPKEKDQPHHSKGFIRGQQLEE